MVIKGRKEMEESAEFKALPKREREKRRYQLPETISVWICDFDLPSAKNEYWDEWALYSRHAIRNGIAVPLSKKISIFSLQTFGSIGARHDDERRLRMLGCRKGTCS